MLTQALAPLPPVGSAEKGPEKFHKHAFFALYEEQRSYTWASKFEPYVNLLAPGLFSMCPMFQLMDFFQEACMVCDEAVFVTVPTP